MNRRAFFGLSFGLLPATAFSAPGDPPAKHWRITCDKDEHVIFQFGGAKEYAERRDEMIAAAASYYKAPCAYCGGRWRKGNQFHFETGWREA